jgi:hypothetical protein
MAEVLHVLSTQYRKRQWLDSFRQDPNNFIKEWFEAFSRDREVS